MWRAIRWLAISLPTAAVITAASAVGTDAQRRALPIDDAVMLLGWSGTNVPQIELVVNKPFLQFRVFVLPLSLVHWCLRLRHSDLIGSRHDDVRGSA